MQGQEQRQLGSTLLVYQLRRSPEEPTPSVVLFWVCRNARRCSQNTARKIAFTNTGFPGTESTYLLCYQQHCNFSEFSVSEISLLISLVKSHKIVNSSSLNLNLPLSVVSLNRPMSFLDPNSSSVRFSPGQQVQWDKWHEIFTSCPFQVSINGKSRENPELLLVTLGWFFLGISIS